MGSISKTKEAIKIMTAYLEGATIQFRGDVCEDWEDCSPNPEWDWMHYEYRIKPTIQYRPYESEIECIRDLSNHLPHNWIKLKNKNHYVQLMTINSNIDFAQMFETYTYLDGNPFGIKVE